MAGVILSNKCICPCCLNLFFSFLCLLTIITHSLQAHPPYSPAISIRTHSQNNWPLKAVHCPDMSTHCWHPSPWQPWIHNWPFLWHQCCGCAKCRYHCSQSRLYVFLFHSFFTDYHPKPSASYLPLHTPDNSMPAHTCTCTTWPYPPPCTYFVFSTC